jgi:hypothetical protein
MGLGPFRNCKTNYWAFSAPAPNPSPDRWTLLEKAEYKGGYVLRVRYHDCTNFEGVKVMVYRGKYAPQRSLDPHFCYGPDSPVARFRPDEAGWEAACAYASSLGNANAHLESDGTDC